jgi:glycosyltransferase involved in cell wall biosynthesis
VSAILRLNNRERETQVEVLLREISEMPELRNRLVKELLGASACRQLGMYEFPDGFKLSVVIPVYNEKRWVGELVSRVQAVPVPKEIILVNDCSTDGTREILEEIKNETSCIVLHHEINQGKGAALRTGFQAATGDVIVVQDADLEYDPAEYPRLLQPIIEGRADVVYGTRLKGDGQRVLHFWHYMINKGLTLFSNFFTNLNFSDMETCYKVFRREVLDGIKLKSNRFGFEPEFTAKIAKKKNSLRVYEIPIGYSGRTYAEGKKIGFKDAFQALYCIVRYAIAN